MSTCDREGGGIISGASVCDWECGGIIRGRLCVIGKVEESSGASVIGSVEESSGGVYM